MNKLFPIVLALLFLSCDESNYRKSDTILNYKGDFEIQFPGKYKKESNSTPDFVNSETYVYYGEEHLYRVDILDFKSKPKGTLRDGMNGAVEAVSGSLIEHQFGSVDGYETLKYKYIGYESMNNQKLGFSKLDFVLDTYRLVAVSITGNQICDSYECSDFFNSLKINE